MKAIHWIIAAAALAFVQPTPVQAAAGDPEIILYRFPGVVDNGREVVTVFHCTNFSGATETIRIVIRNNDGALRSNSTFNVAHLATRTAVTLGFNVVMYIPDVFLPGDLIQGTAAIAATSTSIVCTAMTVDRFSPNPTGIALHGIRFNPAPGSQE